MRFFALLPVAIVYLTSCAPHTDQVKSAPSDKDGLVVFVAGAEPFYYGISILEYDDVKQRVNWGAFGTAPSLTIEPSNELQFVSAKFSPGLYAFQKAWQQGKWVICLTTTLKFQVNAGEITYLGILDNKALLNEIERKAIAEGKTVFQGIGTAATFSSDGPPSFDIPDSGIGDLKSVKDYANAAFPKLNWKITPALMTAATIPLSDNLFPGDKACGR